MRLRGCNNCNAITWFYGFPLTRSGDAGNASSDTGNAGPEMNVDAAATSGITQSADAPLAKEVGVGCLFIDCSLLVH